MAGEISTVKQIIPIIAVIGITTTVIGAISHASKRQPEVTRAGSQKDVAKHIAPQDWRPDYEKAKALESKRDWVGLEVFCRERLAAGTFESMWKDYLAIALEKSGSPNKLDEAYEIRKWQFNRIESGGPVNPYKFHDNALARGDQPMVNLAELRIARECSYLTTGDESPVPPMELDEKDPTSIRVLYLMACADRYAATERERALQCSLEAHELMPDNPVVGYYAVFDLLLHRQPQERMRPILERIDRTGISDQFQKELENMDYLAGLKRGPVLNLMVAPQIPASSSPKPNR
jgi:hypothetical protein